MNTLRRPRYLDKAHANSAHLGELVDGLEAVVDGLGEQLGELLVVEDLEAAAARDLAHGGGVEAVVVVAVAALHEDAAVAQALGVHLASYVVQVNACQKTSTSFVTSTSLQLLDLLTQMTGLELDVVDVDEHHFHVIYSGFNIINIINIWVPHVFLIF